MASYERSPSNSIGSHPRQDVEKSAALVMQTNNSVEDNSALPSYPWLNRFTAAGVEVRGVQPVPPEERTDRRTMNILSFWLSASTSLLPVTTGLIGTLFRGLSVRDACLTILFFGALAGLGPATFSTLGPRTGMRQVVQSRYSYGAYAVGIIVLLNLASSVGWTIINSIVAGQTLSALSQGSVSWALGIGLAALIALVVAFMGYKVLHYYQRFAWIPSFIALLILTGCGASRLKNQAETPPATAYAVLSFASKVVSYTLSWSSSASDFCVYIQPTESKWKVFLYVYAGLLVPTISFMSLGAAMGGAIKSVPAFSEAYALYGGGGVALEMLSPAGGFGKFVAVILAFSVIGNMTGTVYAKSVQFQGLIPIFAKVPRFCFTIIIAAVAAGVAIPISDDLQSSLINFLSLVGYWVSMYVGVFATEHFYFRRGDTTTYDANIWNVGSKLPLGAAALTSSILPIGLIVPSMANAWYVGPIGKYAGDIGLEVGLVLSVMCYLPLRTIEKRVTGR